jgi:hypothetical protein
MEPSSEQAWENEWAPPWVRSWGPLWELARAAMKEPAMGKERDPPKEPARAPSWAPVKETARDPRWARVTVRSLGPGAAPVLAPAKGSEWASAKEHSRELRSWGRMSDVHLGHERESERARSLAAQSTGTKTANSSAQPKELKKVPSKA